MTWARNRSCEDTLLFHEAARTERHAELKLVVYGVVGSSLVFFVVATQRMRSMWIDFV